jgi:hypothetical protein
MFVCPSGQPLRSNGVRPAAGAFAHDDARNNNRGKQQFDEQS